VIAATEPSALWYLTRGTGLVTLVLLTTSVVLGILQVLRWAPPGSPRFMVVTLHRAISLLVVALLVVHVLTAVLDSFAPIRLLDAVLPFAGSYRPLWLGLGALGFDLIVALTVTSLLRRRLGLGAWRAVHWLAYACWPVALVHGWGTGSDTRTTWMLAVTLGCAAAILVAVGWRLVSGWPEHARVRGVGLGACFVVTAVLGIWLSQGPLASGWVRRSGTPAALLASTAPASARAAAAQPRRTVGSPLLRPFSAGLRGAVHQGLSAGGMAVVDLRLRLTGGVHGLLRVRIAGQPSGGGGVLMSRSAVTLGPSSTPGEFKGRVVSLQGSSLEALVGSAAGRALRLRVDLALSEAAVRGTVSARPLTETAG
jgi:Ferric reductase like transmembrane component